MKTFLLLVAVLIGYTTAHLCLIYPHQRGSANNLNTSGSDDCLLIKDPPCGGRPAHRPRVTIVAGEVINIVFQKNLDHYNPNNPGSFDISLWDPSQKNITSVKDSPPNDDKQYLYSMNITVPSDAKRGGAFLQVIYVTNNKNAPPEFYQCADVMVM